MKPQAAARSLDQLVTLQKRATGTDSLGHPSETWEDVADVWAKVEPVTTRDQFEGGRQVALGTYKVTIRFRADVLPSWRLMWRGRPLVIMGEPMDVGSAKSMTQLICASGEVS